MVLGLDRHFPLLVLPLILIETVLYHYAFTSSDWRTFQTVLGLLGLWWCFAALWVEVRLEKVYPGFDHANPEDPEMKAYKPFCDFAPWANCSQVLMSPPGRFLRYFGVAKEGNYKDADGLVDMARCLIDVPNPVLGVAFFGAHLIYPALLLIPIPFLPWIFFLACVFVGLMTVWLAYNLFFVLQDFCVVCVSMYVSNFALIPMMYGMSVENKGFDEFDPFFGKVPDELLYPFLALDAVMAAAVVALYLSTFVGKKVAARESSRYIVLGD